MGPIDSKVSKAGVIIKGSNEAEEVRVSHPKFASLSVVKGDNEDELLKIAVGVPNEKQYNLWKEEVSKLGQLQSLLLPKSSTFAKQGFCGNSGTAQIIYEFFPYLLKDQIVNRECLNKKYFEEPELWYLVQSLLSAADIFHGKGEKIGDVRPENVFISEDGSIKIANHLSWPLEQINYSKTFFQKQITYLAPEEIKDIQFGKTESTSIQELAETFSVGLTILDAVTLSESKDLYLPNRKFDFQKLEEKIRILRELGYSEPLTFIVANMCDVDPDNRVSCRELLQWLEPYEEAINNFEEFRPNQYPEKIQKMIRPVNSQYQPMTYVPPQNTYSAQQPIGYPNQPYPFSNQPINQQTTYYSQPISYSNQPTFSNQPTYLNQPATYSNYNSFNGNEQPKLNPVYIDSSKYNQLQNEQTVSFNQPPAKFSQFTPPPVGVVHLPGQPLQPIQISAPTYTYVGNPGGANAPLEGGNSGVNRFSLDKIDEQLSMSRKMFPS